MLNRLFGTLLLATATAIAQTTPEPPLAPPDPGRAVKTRHRSGRDILVMNCVTIDSELQEFGTASIATGALDCAQQGRYGEGAKLFLLAGIDARFDADRAADSTGVDSAQTLTRLVAEALTPEQMAGLARATQDLMNSTQSRRSLCATIRRFAPPADDSTYRSRPTAPASGPARNFDAGREWAKVVQAGLDCPT